MTRLFAAALAAGLFALPAAADTLSVVDPWKSVAPAEGSMLSSTVWAAVNRRTWLTKPAAG
jgi:hypothetical protein